MDDTTRRVADLLQFMGQLLEIRGEDAFKIRAYYRAADQISRLAQPISGMSEADLLGIAGIGKHITRKIQEIIANGTFRELEEVRQGIPATLLELLNLEGVGPKTVSKLWQQMGIVTIEDLEKAARSHRLRALRGFGERKEQDILKSIEMYRQKGTRMNRLEADRIVARVASALKDAPFDTAGSYRRGVSTVGDIDITTTATAAVINPRLRAIADEIIDEGEKRTSFRCQGQRVDIRFTKPAEYGTMLLYLTGSKEFNIHLREIALSRGMKLNEYGIEERRGGVLQTFETEEAVFAFLGMTPVPPELRENRGEIERAFIHNLPPLIERADIQGDLHVHSDWSDGQMSLEELARRGEQAGYRYLLCSDHSATLGVAHGLSAERVKGQGKEIERINRTSSCTILTGIEVDIMADGNLGLPNTVLGDLDLVIASIHSGFKQERDVLTRRLLKAMENDHVDIIGHPTGRLLGERPPYDVDLGRVLDVAADTHTALEINASPYRLDLDDGPVRQARDRGIRLAIGTDAHDPAELTHMIYGVTIARRGWCGPADILNTRELRDLLGATT